MGIGNKIVAKLIHQDGSISLFLTLALLLVGTTVSTGVLFSGDFVAKKLTAEYHQNRLYWGLKATLEMVRGDILAGEFTVDGLADGLYKEYPNGSIYSAFGQVGGSIHPFGSAISQKVAVTPYAGSNSPGEYKLIVLVSADGLSQRAEIRLALLNSSPPAVVTLDNWDDQVRLTPFQLAAGSFLPTADARIIAEEDDFNIFTDTTKEYPPYDHSATICFHNDNNVGILLTSKSNNFFETSSDVLGITGVTNGDNQWSPGCAPNPVYQQYHRNSVYAAGRMALNVYTNLNNTSSRVEANSPADQMASTTRYLGYERIMASFDQVVNDANCSQADVDIYQIANGSYDPVAVGHIPGAGAAYPRETVLIFTGGTNTINQAIRGKVHMIFNGGGMTTFTANIATVGNVIVHGSGTQLIFSGFLAPPRKVAGDLYIFPTDHTAPPKLSIDNSTFYKSSDMSDYIGLDRLAQIARKVTCTNKTRNNHLHNPFVFQVKSIVAYAN